MTALMVVELVIKLAPLLVSDAEALVTLFSNARSAITSTQASPSGEVSADAWNILKAQELAAMQQIDAEAEAAEQAVNHHTGEPSA